MPPKLKLGGGATVSVVTRFLHPSTAIREKHANIQLLPMNHTTHNLLVDRLEIFNVNKKQQRCCVMTCDEYVDSEGKLIELHAVQRYCKVDKEGDAVLFFTEDAAHATTNNIGELPEEVQNFDPTIDSLELLRYHNIEVDDDNDPLPENIVTQGAPIDDNIFTDWGFSGVCYRTEHFQTTNAKLVNLSHAPELKLLWLFEQLFPVDYIKTTIIARLNETLEKQIDYGEFLRWVGIWFLLATNQGTQPRDYWSTAPINIFVGAPFRVNDLMDQNRFEDILKSIRYARNNAYDTDKFYEVREMIDEWNKNMERNFVPSCVNCLDVSMSTWQSKYACPGFMFVPSKPHPWGNKYHTICCGSTGLLYQMEIVEGKDGVGAKMFDDHGGKTVGLLLRLTRPIWNKGHIVILDSGLCVQQLFGRRNSPSAKSGASTDTSSTPARNSRTIQNMERREICSM